MIEFLKNGRVRAAIAALIVATCAHFLGYELPIDTVTGLLTVLVGLIGGAAIPSELLGTKNPR